MFKISIYKLSLLTFFCFFLKLDAQNVLENYIKEGLEKNEGIKQQHFLVEKNILALKEAKRLYLPNINFQTNYYFSQGGRGFSLPLGDLLNPVYNNLNFLNSLNPITKNTKPYPQVENQSFILNPNNFYDARLRTSFPIFNLEIKHNKLINENKLSLQEIETNIFKRELVKDIKIAYFKYLQATETVKIYDGAIKLAQENARINSELFKNNKIIKSVLLRSENEVRKYTSKKKSTLNLQKSAKNYFNFLLNKSLSDSIRIDSTLVKDQILISNTIDIKNREELQKIELADEISKKAVNLSKSAFYPKLNSFIDIGAQNTFPEFNKNSLYYFFGAVLEWNLFTAGKNKLKVKQLEIENKVIASQKINLTNQLQLQLNNNINSLDSAINEYYFSLEQEKVNNRMYNDTLKIYKEGQALYIELVESQLELINSQIESKILYYEAMIKLAEVERANASFNINK